MRETAPVVQPGSTLVCLARMGPCWGLEKVTLMTWSCWDHLLPQKKLQELQKYFRNDYPSLIRTKGFVLKALVLLKGKKFFGETFQVCSFLRTRLHLVSPFRESNGLEEEQGHCLGPFPERSVCQPQFWQEPQDSVTVPSRGLSSSPEEPVCVASRAQRIPRRPGVGCTVRVLSNAAFWSLT